MLYEYPVMESGYKWNAMQKIAIALNIPIENIYLCGTQENDYIGFKDITLTIEQKTILDNIMANSPCSIPTNIGKTTYKAPNLYGMRKWFSSQWGIEPIFWLDEPLEDGMGECYIHLQFPRVLTATEKKQIINVYTSALKEV